MILPLLPTLLLVFSILFLYFILQVKTRLETSQGAPSPHQTAGNVVNGSPSRTASSRAQKGGHGKISAVDPTESNMGLFHPSFFVLLFLTSIPLTFSFPIPHGSDRLHTVPPPPRCRPRRPPRLKIGTLNIRYDQSLGLVQDIQAVEREGFDVMMSNETKIQSEVYLKNRLG